MTNMVAFLVGLTIVTAIVVDIALFGTEHILFLLRKMDELIEWLAVWR